MATIITDPDFLSQGNTTSWAASNPGQSAIPTSFTVDAAPFSNAIIANTTSTALPNWNQYAYFEIRGATSANNNGLYQVDNVLTAGQSYKVTKVAGAQGSLTVTAGDTSTFYLGANTIPGEERAANGLANTQATGKSVYFDTYQKKIWLIPGQGNLSDEGVTLQSLYSFTKEEWKNDPYLIQFDFPFTAITPEQFEIGSGTSTGWQLFANTITVAATHDGVNGNGRKTQELVRTAGWREFDIDGTTILREYAGVISLGTFDDNNDLAYFQQGDDPEDTNAPEDFVFTGPVNEGVRIFDYVPGTDYGTLSISSDVISRTNGDWIAEGYQKGGRIEIISSDASGDIGTYVITALTTLTLTVDSAGSPLTDTGGNVTFEAAVDNRNVLNLFLRANSSVDVSKAYAASDLPAIGVTTMTNQVYRFPLTNSSDIKVQTDFDVTSSPYDEIDIKYFDSAFKLRVDGSDDPTPRPLREFGIVVDNGTYSGVDGALTTGSSNLVSTNSDIPAGTFDGGRLYVYTSTANSYPKTPNPYYDIVTAVGANVQISGSFENDPTATNVSFALYKATPLSTDLEDVYTVVQYKLRQAADINGLPDATSGEVVGKTADEIMFFVGDDLFTGNEDTSLPTNPNGGGTGVFLNGYISADTNRFTMFDNSSTSSGGTPGIGFPTTVTITLSFNSNLTDDQVAATGTYDNSKFWLFYEYTRKLDITSGNIQVQNVSGFDAELADSGNVFTRTKNDGSELQVGDYIRVSGFTNSENNGTYRITSAAAGAAINLLGVTKSDGIAPVTEGTGANPVSIFEDPIDTPDAILVEAPSPVTGNANTTSIKTFSYDFDTNTQGAKEAQSIVPLILRSIGLEKGQFVESAPTNLQSTAFTVSVVAGLERNYSNP